MRVILIVTALLLTGLGLGEFAMIGAFLGLAVMCWFWFARRVVALTVCLASLGGLVLHSQGYKVFGSARVVESPKLVNARELAALEPPATLRFADGGRETLTGIYFPSAVDLTDPHSGALTRMFHIGTGRPPEVRVSAQGATRRAEYRRRNEYWCGNTFFPTFFPRRLPSHRVVDFGALLVQCGYALPDGTSPDEEDYTKQLLEAFDRSFSDSLSPIAARIPKGDPVATALGRQLLEAKDKMFVSGAMLLIAAQDVESYEEIRAEILRREKLNRATYDQVAQARSVSLRQLLAWVEPQVAKEQLQSVVSSLKMIRASGASELQSALRRTLWPVLANGDLAEIDALVMEMGKGESPLRSYVSQSLPELFRWPAGSPHFQRWYWACRPELNSGRSQTGALAMWLTGGEPFDSTYMESMGQFTALD